MVHGNRAADLRRWTAKADPAWLAGIEVVATDLAESFRAGLSPHLYYATRVADPFHVVRVGNRCLDKVRRRVQNETLGYRGRKHDPLYRIRKLLLAGSERLDERGQDRLLLGLRVGDPHDEVRRVAWRKNRCARCISPTIPTKPHCCSTRRSSCAPTTPSPRSDPWVRTRGVARRDPRSPPDRRIERPDRRPQPLRQEGQALRARVPHLRALPPTRPPPRRRHHLARPTITTTDQNRPSLLTIHR